MSARELFAYLLIAGLICVSPQARSWNDRSRLATTQSLAEHGRFAIEGSAFFDTGDKLLIDGRYYSDKPPTLPALMALLYLPLHRAGLRLADEPWNPAYLILLWVVIRGGWWLSLLAYDAAIREYDLPAPLRLLATAGLGLGTLYFCWGSVISNHAPSAALLMVGLLALLRARQAAPEAHARRHRALAAAGLALALCAAVDIPSTLFYAAFGAMVLATPRLRGPRLGGALAYALPALVMLPNWWLIYHLTGALTPLQFVPEYFDWPGSPVTIEALSGTRVNSWRETAAYAFTCLLGERGFLLYNPILFLAVPLMIRAAWRGEGPFAAEARWGGLAVLGTLAYYLTRSRDFSGWSYSIRWFVTYLPLLMLYLPAWLAPREGEPPARHATRVRVAVDLLLTGAAISLVGCLQPWSSQDVLLRLHEGSGLSPLAYVIALPLGLLGLLLIAKLATQRLIIGPLEAISNT